MFLTIFTSLLLSFSIRLGLAIALWPHRRTVMHQLLFFVQIFYMIWSFLVLACISIDDFETKVILTQMRQLFLPLLMPTWFLLAVGIFFKSTFQRIGAWRYAIFIPAFVVIAGNVASMLGLPFATEWIFYDFQSSDTTNGLLLFKYGSLMKFNFVYIYLLNVSVIVTLIYIAIRHTGLRRSSALLLLAASSTYIVVDFIGRRFFPELHLVQLSVATTWPGGLILFYVMAKLELLDVKGLAQQRVFESLPSPVVTVNPTGFFWDANASALDVLDLQKSMIGTAARSLPSLSPLIDGQKTVVLKNRIYQVFCHHLKFRGVKSNSCSQKNSNQNA